MLRTLELLIGVSVIGGVVWFAAVALILLAVIKRAMPPTDTPMSEEWRAEHWRSRR